MKQLLVIVGSILTACIGIWKKFSRINRFKRKQAEQAQKDLDNAIKNDSPSDFLDSFGRM